MHDTGIPQLKKTSLPWESLLPRGCTPFPSRLGWNLVLKYEKADKTKQNQQSERDAHVEKSLTFAHLLVIP
ncbi:hypothetical protein I79_021533 [Cricetulus griseus]|uniref:Uncharacterized protein n=1 Tax=Cricetulus griseus TaxID=10029 RepID=G3ICX8_CRIGR|nr:hypothetical protein I79_021533 [Cricetulus griseus]